jgi:hypothetical protein
VWVWSTLVCFRERASVRPSDDDRNYYGQAPSGESGTKFKHCNSPSYAVCTAYTLRLFSVFYRIALGNTATPSATR